jgi:Zn-dependent metalloprotease
VKFLKQGLSLALLGAGLAAVPGLQAVAAGQTPAVAADSLVQQIRSAADGSVKMSTERATGKIGFVRATGNGDLLPSVEGDSTSAAVSKVAAYLKKFGPAFGAPYDQLTQSRVTSTKYGWTVSYTQAYKGVPVFGSTLKANVDRAGDLTSVDGYAAPIADLSTSPRLTKSEAASRAVATVRVNPPGEGKVDVSGIKAGSNDLVIYRMGSLKGQTGKSVLTYMVEVTNGRNIRDAVFVDAQNGKLLNRYSLDDTAETNRELYDVQVDADHLVWKDGDAFPGTLDTDEQNLMLDAGSSFWLYQNTFGYESFDGAGAKMITVENYVDPKPDYCPNANWNGSRINMCPGAEADDVVSHEWGHAYTQYTNGLIYQWQSGALNESYSDVWGETIDLINGRNDGDEGDITTPRPVGLCSTHSAPTPLVTINAPSGIAKDCLTGGYLGPRPLPTITSDVVIPSDVADEGGSTTDGCSTYDNPGAAVGKIVMVDRGLCTFVQKAEVAKDAGAAALIIGNRDESPVGFSSADDTLVPTVSIGLTDRETIRSAIAAGESVNVTISDASSERANSYRWLIGEDAPAFGGALRDMWVPTCMGDPGKVSDAEYKCSTDDNGGVHGNSGVANHAYALLVDGGTYNGVTVPGIGLDKAANIYWITQLNYLTPTSDFTDMADGLDAACTSLIGQPIKKLSIARNAPGDPAAPITSADCTSVSLMEQAVEFRKDPTNQCNFTPILKKNPPAVCGKDYKTKTLWKEDFEKGLKNWSQSEVHSDVEPGHGFPWKAVSNAPQHSSKAAYGPDPDGGSCAGDDDDYTSANLLKSKAIKLTGGKFRRLSFQHYVATEAGYDGGNVKISVNGKSFKVIPSAAYLFNGPNATLTTLAEGGTNPLNGEEGFTGTDGGTVFGSWGTSIVDLKKAGAHVGDKIKLRFDMGRDGCGGNDGWYVDNILVQVCQKKKHHHKAVAGDNRATVKHS